MKLYKPLLVLLLFLLTTLAFPWGSELCQGCRLDSSALAGPIYTFPDSQLFQQMISTNGTFLFQDTIDRLPVYSNGIKLEIRTQNKSPLRLAYDVNNYVDFSVGASGGLTINATGGVVISSNGNFVIRNGNVGIGTPVPGAKLDVNGVINGNMGLPGGYNIGGHRGIVIDNNGALTIGYDTYPIYIGGDATPKITILNNGNVGIGATSPEEKFTVNGYQPAILVRSLTASDARFRSVTTLGDFSSGTGIGIGSNIWNVYDNNAGAIRLAINSAGNVGIGTTSPVQTLSVNGNIGTNHYTKGSALAAGATWSNAFSLASGVTMIVDILSTGAGHATWTGIISYYDGAHYGVAKLFEASYQGGFTVAIDSSGNVSITSNNANSMWSVDVVALRLR